jgi:hypothetical protein
MPCPAHRTRARSPEKTPSGRYVRKSTALQQLQFNILTRFILCLQELMENGTYCYCAFEIYILVTRKIIRKYSKL